MLIGYMRPYRHDDHESVRFYANLVPTPTCQFSVLDSLAQSDPKTGLSSLAWLKAMPVAAKADNVLDILERLTFVRAVGIPVANSVALHPDRYRQFVRMSPSYTIERYTASRRRATLVAFLIDAEERLTDAAIDMADKLIGSMFTRARCIL